MLAGRAKTGIALTRPPGHHAKKSLASGFCLLNNIALAVSHALATSSFERILVFDWDVHHGS